MNTLAPYIAGGLIALFSEGILGLAVGQPTVLRTDAISSTFASLQETVPVSTDALPGQPNFVQQVNRSLKGDRLVPKHAPESIVASTNTPQGIKRPVPAIKPSQPPRLPEGCNAAVSVLSDRIAANQASNCITALEVPWKVASAN